jgi:hypothetical protein
VEFWAAKGARRYPVLFLQARDARRSIIQALLADAVLRGRAQVRSEFVVVVGAPLISAAMAHSIEQYVATRTFERTVRSGITEVSDLVRRAARIASERATPPTPELLLPVFGADSPRLSA